MHKENDLSIIVPTFNRPDNVMDLLASLQSQLGSKDEVVIVDDGSSSRSRDLLQEGLANLNIPQVNLFLKPHGGVSEARNAGIEKAINEFLVFVDDDVIADSRWIGTMRQSAVSFPAVQGVYWLQGGNSQLDRQHALWRRLVTQQKQIDTGGRLARVNTRNFAVNKAALINACGRTPFKGNIYRRPGGEDYCLGLQFVDARLSVVINENAVVYHLGDSHGISGLMRQKYQHGIGDAMFGVLCSDTFSAGNFNRAVIHPVRSGVSYQVAVPLWAAYTLGAAIGSIYKKKI